MLNHMHILIAGATIGQVNLPLFFHWSNAMPSLFYALPHNVLPFAMGLKRILKIGLRWYCAFDCWILHYMAVLWVLLPVLS